jgi:hypothetical protein
MATIRVKLGSETTDFVDVNLESTVAEFRKLIREKLNIDADVGMKVVQLVVTRNKVAATPAPAGAPATPAAPQRPSRSDGNGGSPGGAGSPGGMGIDPNQLRQLLAHPEGRQLIQALLSNPGMLAQLMQSSPELANNPEALAMLRNPEFLAMMSDPANIERALTGDAAAGPRISRDIYAVALRCMNGEAIPAGYPYAGRTVGGGDVLEGDNQDDGDDAMDTEDAVFEEIVSREQIRAALVVALGGEEHVRASAPRPVPARPAAVSVSASHRNPSSSAGAAGGGSSQSQQQQ